MKFERQWKPSRHHFKSSKWQGKIFRRDILWIPCTITSQKNVLKKYMLVMITRMIVTIGMWIVFISGMKTTFIFYLKTLLHLLYSRSWREDKILLCILFFSFLILQYSWMSFWLALQICIHMNNVDIRSIIFNWLLSYDIFNVELTWSCGHGTQVYSGVWTTSIWWLELLHGSLFLNPTSASWSVVIHGTLVYGFTPS